MEEVNGSHFTARLLSLACINMNMSQSNTQRNLTHTRKRVLTLPGGWLSMHLPKKKNTNYHLSTPRCVCVVHLSVLNSAFFSLTRLTLSSCSETQTPAATAGDLGGSGKPPSKAGCGWCRRTLVQLAPPSQKQTARYPLGMGRPAPEL